MRIVVVLSDVEHTSLPITLLESQLIVLTRLKIEKKTFKRMAKLSRSDLIKVLKPEFRDTIGVEVSLLKFGSAKKYNYKRFVLQSHESGGVTGDEILEMLAQ